jgi:putative transposase
MRFAFIGAEKARHSIPLLCRMLKVSRSGYYAWRRRGPSRRALEDSRLGTLIVASHRDGRGTYGSPRILDDLREAGERVSRKRVARLMKERSLVGELKKRWRHPSSAPSDAVVAPNTLNRAFNVPQPNRIWASDITYVRTYEGWLYLAVVIDLFARRVVGWATSDRLHKELTLSALRRAIAVRSPAAGLIHHADSQWQPVLLPRLPGRVEEERHRDLNVGKGKLLR